MTFANLDLTEIEKLNQSLREEELQIRKVFLKLKKNAEFLIEKNLISDYETELTLELYSFDEEICKSYNVELGDPFYKSNLLGTKYFEDDELFFTNWKEDNLPVEICYSMHNLLYDSRLTIKEILATENFDFDLDFKYQFEIRQ